jgi:hypothetical protein
MQQVLVCPICGQEMEEGYIAGLRGYPFPWLPKYTKIPWFSITSKRISARGGLYLLIDGQWELSLTKLPVSICKNCGQGRFVFSNT